MAQQLRRTPLFETHQAEGARLIPFAGWEMPVSYAGVLQEHASVREGAGLFDVSHMGELRFRGEGAVAFIDALVTNDVDSLSVGGALYTLACHAEGGILDDLIVYRLAQDDFMVVCNASNRDKMSAHFASCLNGQCEYEDQSDATALLALQGPQAASVMRELSGDTFASLPRFGVGQGKVAGIEVTVARTGYTGEDGFELFCAPASAPALWKALRGCETPVAPVGLGARDTLRLEAALRLYGQDMDEQTNPYEAGLGWTVKLDRGEFLGRDVLKALRTEGPARKLSGLQMVGRGIARHGYPVVDAQGQRIGEVTSGSPGPTVGKHIALAYLPPALAKAGNTVWVEIRGKSVEATTVALPFYKRA